MKKKNRLQMLAALLAATLSMTLTSPIAAKANEEYNVDATKESNAETGRIYYLKNSHGDVIGQMDENGTVLTSYAYNAFGEQVSVVATKGGQKSTANRFLYAGEQYDETSGLYYLRARHYDVKAGRFTQEDTYLGDGRNLYAYVHSNPLKYVDPTGHYDQENFDPDGNSWDEKIKNEGGGGGQSGSNAVNSNNIRFSQSSVNGSVEIVESMKNNGWVGDPIDVVKMPDGGLTTIDNTRVVAARQVGIDVQANIHAYDDLLPSGYTDRFTTKQGVPTTWGDAITLRIGNQNATFRNNSPFGSVNMNDIR